MTILNSKRKIDGQEEFMRRIIQEWRRAERCGRPALLVLLEGLQKAPQSQSRIVDLVSSMIRETDHLGWYKTDATLGVIFLDLDNGSIECARYTIMEKIESHILHSIDADAVGIRAEGHMLPPYRRNGSLDGTDAEFAESLTKSDSREVWLATAIKRLMDICGSLLLLIACLPGLLVIAACIRLTSRGPALFRQTRTGFGGRTFGLYKFRTMEVQNDDRLHHEYVKQFINGEAESRLDEHGERVYKLTEDPRITKVGRFLRRTSMDELPQLWNVLRGEMSLVGPRPPLSYEVECYNLWHWRRLFELKPGLTGLWQVRGRSRCSFDEMVRMDLQHGRKHSIALYIRVLLETPRAVIHGSGAH